MTTESTEEKSRMSFVKIIACVGIGLIFLISGAMLLIEQHQPQPLRVSKPEIQVADETGDKPQPRVLFADRPIYESHPISSSKELVNMTTRTAIPSAALEQTKTLFKQAVEGENYGQPVQPGRGAKHYDVQVIITEIAD